MSKRAPNWTKEEDNLLIANKDKSIKELADIIGRTDGAIRSRKTFLGIKRNICRPFSDCELEIIKYWYTKMDGVDLEFLANVMQRGKTVISGKAGDMGLTKYANWTPEKKIEIIDKLNEGRKRVPHPRGMLGKHFSEETLKKLAESHKKYRDSLTKEEKHEIAMKAARTRALNGSGATTENAYSNCKQGFRNDIGCYFRSSWEANFARILDYCNIKWEYEYERFVFPYSVDGVLSYQPDFYLPEYNLWIEIKGWMDYKSKLRLKMFNWHYPNYADKFILINEDFYYFLVTHFKDKIDNLEKVEQIKKYKNMEWADNFINKIL